MTPIEIRKENARREREERRKQRNTLPPRQPAPASAKEEIARIKAELAARRETK
jgi:hypothetical protein